MFLCFAFIDILYFNAESGYAALYELMIYVQCGMVLNVLLCPFSVSGSRKVQAADREKMPYTNAVLHEVMRLRPISALTVVHVATEELVLSMYWSTTVLL